MLIPLFLSILPIAKLAKSGYTVGWNHMTGSAICCKC